MTGLFWLQATPLGRLHLAQMRLIAALSRHKMVPQPDPSRCFTLTRCRRLTGMGLSARRQANPVFTSQHPAGTCAREAERVGDGATGRHAPRIGLACRARCTSGALTKPGEPIAKALQVTTRYRVVACATHIHSVCDTCIPGFHNRWSGWIVNWNSGDGYIHCISRCVSYHSYTVSAALGV